MKYRHAYHAGNFADVHKHVTLLALLEALKRKDKGFFCLETHAGRGLYDLAGTAASTGRAAETGVNRVLHAPIESAELTSYAKAVTELRAERGNPHLYPGSPLLTAGSLRPQDRALFAELLPAEAKALAHHLGTYRNARVECGDGFELLRGQLPPPERRGIVLIDPPYEDSRGDFARVSRAIAETLRRFETAVLAVWYPIKDRRDIDAWHAALAPTIARETLISELWLFPCDSRVALNGSGLLIVNPPYQIAERMRSWLPQLRELLDVRHMGGTSLTALPRGPRSGAASSQV